MEHHDSRSAAEMDRRLTTFEVELMHMGRRLDTHVADSRREGDALLRAVETLDRRQDRSDIFTARLIGGLLVAQFLVILIAPAVRAAIGLS